MKTNTTSQNASLFILRIITASIFYVAAYFKFPFWSGAPAGMSTFLVFSMRLLSIVEPLGATAVLFGFLTRWAAAGLIIILIAAIYVSITVYGIRFVMPTYPGWNFPLAMIGGCLILASFGAGKWSVDNAKSRR